MKTSSVLLIAAALGGAFVLYKKDWGAKGEGVLPNPIKSVGQMITNAAKNSAKSVADVVDPTDRANLWEQFWGYSGLTGNFNNNNPAISTAVDPNGMNTLMVPVYVDPISSPAAPRDTYVVVPTAVPVPAPAINSKDIAGLQWDEITPVLNAAYTGAKSSVTSFFNNMNLWAR